MPNLNPQTPSLPRLNTGFPLSPVAADATRVAIPFQQPQPALAPSQDQLQVNAQGSANTSVSLTSEPQFIEHTVKRGETLGKIAQEYLGNPNQHLEIFQANADDLRNPNDIRVGMVLKIPVPASETTPPARPVAPPVQPTVSVQPPAVPVQPAEEPQYASHTVKRGESLSTIALRHLGDSERYMEIYEANRDQLRSPNALSPGMSLKIPSRTPAVGQNQGQAKRPVAAAAPAQAAAAVDASGLTAGARELLDAMQRYQQHHNQLGNTNRTQTSAAEMREIAIELDSASRAFDVDPKLMLAMFAHESGGFNPRARSHTGAGGLGQLTGVAIRQVHHMAGIGKGNTGRSPFTQHKQNFVQNHRTITERFDIKKNVWTATAYMSYELNDRARLGRGVENALKRYGDPNVSTYTNKVNDEYRTLFGSRLF